MLSPVLVVHETLINGCLSAVSKDAVNGIQWRQRETVSPSSIVAKIDGNMAAATKKGTSHSGYRVMGFGVRTHVFQTPQLHSCGHGTPGGATKVIAGTLQLFVTC